jgi:hypothetical protein
VSSSHLFSVVLNLICPFGGWEEGEVACLCVYLIVMGGGGKGVGWSYCFLLTSVIVAKSQGIEPCTFHEALVGVASQYYPIHKIIDSDVVLFAFLIRQKEC